MQLLLASVCILYILRVTRLENLKAGRVKLRWERNHKYIPLRAKRAIFGDLVLQVAYIYIYFINGFFPFFQCFEC
jgi:hypothetical protein